MIDYCIVAISVNYYEILLQYSNLYNTTVLLSHLPKGAFMINLVTLHF